MGDLPVDLPVALLLVALLVDRLAWREARTSDARTSWGDLQWVGSPQEGHAPACLVCGDAGREAHLRWAVDVLHPHKWR